MKKQLGTISGLMCALLLAVPAISTATVTNDQVTSIKLKEADNNGSQDTNSGSGVKTGHIQNNAVTTDKILDGAVGNLDLANNAVTDAKISGLISASKLPVGTSSGTVAAGDHDHDTSYQKKYANVVVVAKSGGEFTDPIAAINSITNASAMNPYLIKIMPGVYDLGNSTLYMKEYVDIEGSGENGTVITSAVCNISTPDMGTVNGSNNAEIRFLTVNSAYSACSGYAGAITNFNASPKLTHVTATASGFNGYAYGVGNFSSSSPTMSNVTAQGTIMYSGYGVAIGIWSISSSPTMVNVLAVGTEGNASLGIKSDSCSLSMTNVRAIALGGINSNVGIANTASSVEMNSVTASASGPTGNTGIRNTDCSGTMLNISVTAENGEAMHNYSSGTLLVDHSSFSGSISGIYNEQGVNIRIGASKLAGGLIGPGTDTSACAASYDGNYAPLGVNCQ